MTDETALRRYVLGLAGEEERVRVEERVFASDALLDDIAALEVEVTDEYAAAELAPDEAAAFEKRLATNPHLRSRLDITRALRSAQSRTAAWRTTPHSRRSWMPWMAAAAGFLVVAASSVLWLRQGTEVPATPQTTQTTPAGPAPGSPSAQPGPAGPRTPAPAPTAPSVIATFTLSPTLVRSAPPSPEVARPAGAGLVAFQLLLEPGDEFPAYAVRLTTSDGRSVWSSSQVRAGSGGGGPAVVVSFPAARLAPGRYEFLVSGLRQGKREDLGVYHFRVSR